MSNNVSTEDESTKAQPSQAVLSDPNQTTSNDSSTNDDIEAAQILLNLRRESASALQLIRNKPSLDNGSDSYIAVLVQHFNRLPRFITDQLLSGVSAPQPPAQQVTKKRKKVRVRTPHEMTIKRERDAALALVKLSDQSRTPSQAALTLLKLRYDSFTILREQEMREQQKQIPLAQRALETRDAADQSLALGTSRVDHVQTIRDESGSDDDSEGMLHCFVGNVDEEVEAD